MLHSGIEWVEIGNFAALRKNRKSAFLSGNLAQIVGAFCFFRVFCCRCYGLASIWSMSAVENLRTSYVVIQLKKGRRRRKRRRRRRRKRRKKKTNLPGEGHVLMSDLQPSTGGGAEIDADAGILQKSEFSVQLNQFKGGSRTVAGFLGEFVKLILTRLSGLHFLPHDEASATHYSNEERKEQILKSKC